MGLEINTGDFWKELDQRVIDARTERKLFIEEITELRAKVAELEAKLAKYENLEPVAYSVMCDGEHPGNVFGQKQTAESKMQSLDASWPEHSRKVVPLYALEK